MARNSQNIDDMLQNLDFINSYPNEMRNRSLSPGGNIDDYFDRRSELLDETTVFFDVDDENLGFVSGGTSTENATTGSGRSKRAKSSSRKRQPLKESTAANMDDSTVEDIAIVRKSIKSPKRVALETPKPSKSVRRRSSLKGSVVARRSARIATKTMELARAAVSNSEVRSSRAKSAVPRSARKPKEAKARRTKRSLSVGEGTENAVPVQQVNASFSSELVNPDEEDGPSARARESISSVQSTATFVVEASPPPQYQASNQDDVFEEEIDVVLPSVRSASHRRTMSDTVHDRPHGSQFASVDGDDSDDDDDDDEDTRPRRRVAAATSARRRAAASTTDLTLKPLCTQAAAHRATTRVEPFHFRIDDRLAARKRKAATEAVQDHAKKSKVTVPDGLKGNILALNFFERQELARKKQDKLKKEAEQKEREMREFHAAPAPGSHSTHSSWFTTTHGKTRRQAEPEEKHQFRANPVPKSVLKPRKMQIQHKSPTRPQPFRMPGDERMKKRRSYDRRQKQRQEVEELERERKRQEEEARLDKEQEEFRRRTNFKAKPIPQWVNLPAAHIAAPDFSDDD